MVKLGTYNNLEELENNFDVEYINNFDDFYKLVGFVQQEDDTFYRGVCSPKYKMYSSSQRFYHDKIESLELEYVDFLNMLYAVSSQIDNGYLLKLYGDLQKDNYIQYVNTYKKCKSEKIFLGYNPIWAFHTLQHLTSCSPFLDFTKDFRIALYFAAQEMSPLCGNNVPDIDQYIEIISLNDISASDTHNHLTMKDPYKSLTDDYFDSENSLMKLYHSPFLNHEEQEIKYVNYDGSCKIIGKGYEYRFSFINENCIAQSGRLYLTSSEADKPFEVLWNKIFNDKPKLKVYLIHKSLIDEIYKYLTIHLLGKLVVPIKKDYTEEIVELIKIK